MPLPTSLGRFAAQLSAYTELRAQENRSTRLSMLNGNLVSNTSATQSGVSARVFKDGCYGLASNPAMEDDAIADTLRSATRNAAFLSGKRALSAPAFPASGVGGEFLIATQPALTGKQRIECLRALDAYLLEKYTKLSSRSLTFASLDVEKTLLTSDGAQLRSFLPHEAFYLSLSVERGTGEPVELFEIQDAFSISDFLSDAERMRAFADAAYERLMQKREGVYAQAGYKTCVLDARLGGMLAHEAIGHTVEADMVAAGSVAAKCLDQVVASPLISIVDFAHTALGERCPSPVYVDDEGVTAVDAVLIEQGVLRRYMHNKESAARMGHEAQGNARAFLFSDEPLIRMRNTAILPGTDTLEDMIASIDDGYYLISTGNGQADATSEFMFGVTFGYEIKHGKLGHALLDTTVSGVAFDMLKTVSMVSKDMFWTASGYCGKKQPMKVGMGGPAIKCDIMVGGK